VEVFLDWIGQRYFCVVALGKTEFSFLMIFFRFSGLASLGRVYVAFDRADPSVLHQRLEESNAGPQE
jgi:hypothetical protein